MGVNRSSWKRRQNRVTAALLAIIGLFIVYTSLWPRRAAVWTTPDRLPAHVPASLPLPGLLLLLVVVLVIYGITRSRLL